MDHNALWDRFEEVMRRRSPKDLDALRPPATEEQISAAEKAMKVRFPAQLRAAYRRHDGSKHPIATSSYDGGGFFPDGYQWCKLSDMVDHWKMRVEMADSMRVDDHNFSSFPIRSHLWDDLAIRPEWWNNKWVPIGLAPVSSAYYIDLMPGPKGTKGQIIIDSCMQDAMLIAPSLNAWIEFVTDSFESGRFASDPETGGWIDTKWGRNTTKTFRLYG